MRLGKRKKVSIFISSIDKFPQILFVLFCCVSRVDGTTSVKYGWMATEEKANFESLDPLAFELGKANETLGDCLKRN